MPLGNIALHYNVSFKTKFAERSDPGLIVFSDDFLHFLKIKKKKKIEFTKTILWL